MAIKSAEQINARIAALKSAFPSHLVSTATNRAGEKFIARWCYVRQRCGTDLRQRKTIKRLLAWEPVWFVFPFPVSTPSRKWEGVFCAHFSRDNPFHRSKSPFPCLPPSFPFPFTHTKGHCMPFPWPIRHDLPFPLGFPMVLVHPFTLLTFVSHWSLVLISHLSHRGFIKACFRKGW